MKYQLHRKDREMCKVISMDVKAIYPMKWADIVKSVRETITEGGMEIQINTFTFQKFRLD